MEGRSGGGESTGRRAERCELDGLDNGTSANSQVLEQRELDTKDIREALLERDEELASANDRVAELQGAQAETHDRLEETLRNIERDNAEKETDLIAANREVEEVSSQNRVQGSADCVARPTCL